MELSSILPLPAATPPSGESSPSADSSKGEAFAGLLDEAMGKTAESPSGTDPIPAASAAQGDHVPTISGTETTAVGPTAGLATETLGGPGRTRTGVRLPASKVDAPPDPPPTESPEAKGAPTQAPTAHVERPDPILQNEIADPTEEPVAPPSTIADVAAMAALAAACQAVDAPTSSEAGTPAKAGTDDMKPLPASAANAPAPQANRLAVSMSDDGETKATPTDVPLDPTRGPGDGRPAVSTRASILPGASDLGVSSPVAQATAPATDLKRSVVRPVANAEVARVATEPPSAPEATSSARPTADPGDTFGFLGEAEAEMGGGHASGEDAPDGEASQNPNPQTAAASTTRTAATERPEAGMDRPAVDRHLVVRQVADRIESLAASRPKDGVIVHLEPRDLGTVTLVVKGLQNALDVQVTASDERVRQSLDASRPELAQALSPRGLELRELRVATATPSANTASADSNSKGGGSHPEGRARPHHATPTFSKASRAEVAPRASRSKGRGVDLLV